MKYTPFAKTHEALGAKMAEFAGYYMPISYAGIKEEHLCVRNKIGIFDVSHMGEFLVYGAEADQLVQHVTSNDVNKLKVGDAQYSCFPNGKGGIVDDLLVYRLSDGSDINEPVFMLVVNASNIEKDWEWVTSNNTFQARLENISYNSALIAIQGPKAVEVLQKLTSVNLSEIGYYTFQIGEMAGLPNIIISATGYTGSGGFELYVENKDAQTLWDAIMQAGKKEGIQAAGLGARDSLRLEMGYCLYGNDIDDTTSPLEAGLGWITKLKKGPFIDSEFMIDLKASGLSRKLIGFSLEGKRVPRKGYPIEDVAGNQIGEVTSGTMGPSVEMPIGMGYVDIQFSKGDEPIFINIRNKKIPATRTKLPFYKG